MDGCPGLAAELDDVNSNDVAGVIRVRGTIVVVMNSGETYTVEGGGGVVAWIANAVLAHAKNTGRNAPIVKGRNVVSVTPTEKEINEAGRRLKLANLKGKRKNRKKVLPLPDEFDKSQLDSTDIDEMRLAEIADAYLKRIRSHLVRNGKSDEFFTFSNIELILDPGDGGGKSGDWYPNYSGGELYLTITIYLGEIMKNSQANWISSLRITIGHEVVGHTLDPSRRAEETRAEERRAEAMGYYLHRIL